MKRASLAFFSRTAATLSVLVADAASAHPQAGEHGHVTLLQGIWHLLTEPDHLALLAGSILVGYLIWRTLKERSK